MVLNALDEVLFWNEIPLLKNFIQQNMKNYFPHDYNGFYAAKEKFLQQHIPNKRELISKLEYYCKNGFATWVSSRNGCCDDIDKGTVKKAVTVSSKFENGEKKAFQVSKWIKTNPNFWGFYQNHIFHLLENTVLELTIGAGGGTGVIMMNMVEQDCYMGTDIDFICAKNADALAKYYGVNGLGLTTSLWNLPFENEVFTTVCCNAGLEECREVPTILKEAARVLCSKGRLVIRCVKKENALWYSYFRNYGFSTEETEEWLNKVRLFSGVEQIKQQLITNGLTYITQKDDDTLGHIIVFEK